MAQLNDEEIEKRFGFHKAAIEREGIDKSFAHADLRKQFKEFVEDIDTHFPDGRNKSLALTALEEASMWLHKALANDC